MPNIPFGRGVVRLNITTSLNVTDMTLNLRRKLYIQNILPLFFNLQNQTDYASEPSQLVSSFLAVNVIALYLQKLCE